MTAEAASFRVLMTADAVGGVWAYALALAQGLQQVSLRRLAPEVILAVMGPRPSAEQRRRAAEITNLRLLESDFRLEWQDGAERDLAPAGRWLCELAQRWQPDIVHLNGYCHAAEPWKAPVIVVGHSCVLSWWQAVHGTLPPAEWRGYGRRVTLGLARADRVVAPSSAMLRALSHHYGLSRRGSVIPNGIALDRYAPAEKEDFVLAAGRLWDEAKNLAALDAAAAHLPWPVYVAGDCRHPSGREATPRAAQALGTLSPAALARWMARAAIYALPARYEPFGLSVLEAAASGCALVLGDIASLRENWEGAAIFVPPEDSGALAEAVAGLIAAPERRARLGTAALRRAQNFSLSGMAEKYAALYGALAARREAAPRALAEAG